MFISDFALVFLMTPKNKQVLMAKSLTIFVVAAVVAMMICFTVSLKKGPVSGVPISIKLMGPSAMTLWIDLGKTESHFGNPPLYGVQHRAK